MTDFTSTALRVDQKGLWVLDQTLLPQQEVWLLSPSTESMVQIIRELKVRGAPLIGVAASLQLAHLAEQGASSDELEKALFVLREARPTAVNLMNAMDRCLVALKKKGPQGLIIEAESICREDVELCASMAAWGAQLIEDGDQVLTHCNTGGLATAGLGTALGAVIHAARDGKKVHVFVDETRPLLQGGRLTAWELEKNSIPFTLICDSMAAALMQQGKVDRVLVGADRIARNGDFANKVGTYSLAVLCKFHSVPFYVVAPQTTVDVNCAYGRDIPVEERSAYEVRGVRGAFGQVEWSLPHADVWNPAFDVTPESLVTAWVLDRGIFTREDVRKGALL
ncbi:MAG: S-methyl-5-thioribose-1-phosphate isomerase [Bdellovibrionales bacterium]|nr:S-methyl-5-thioribose-1-phosphate isomerase [Bdellovibrionales bacterium]